MTLLYTDGFEHQDVALRGWQFMNGDPSKFSYPSAGSRYGYGNFLRIAGANRIRKGFTPAAKTILGFAINLKTTGASTVDFFYLYGDGGVTNHLTLYRAGGSNTLTLKRGSTTILTGPDTITDGWHYFEIMATIADTGGRFVLKVDGSVYIDYTGDTKNGGTNSTLDTVVLGGSANSSSVGADTDYDDLYICDGLGTKNNDFLGDKRVITLLPNKAGGSSAMTPVGSPNNWDNANELPVSDVDYNASSVVGTRDTYGLSAMPASAKDIAGVQVVIAAKKSDSAGNAFIKPVLTSGASVVQGASVGLPVGLTSIPMVQETDPATSAAWTLAGVNGVNIGAEVS